jgi:hypothetical protein
MVLGRLESLLKGSNIKGALEFAESSLRNPSFGQTFFM